MQTVPTLTQFASAEATSNNVFVALGIDWKMLILQIVAFVILVWLLGKYVYPWLMKSVDDRQAAIEAGAKAAEKAKLQAESAAEEVEKVLHKARKEAKDIVTTARDEAMASLTATELKAADRAKAIVANAHEQIEKDVIAAKKSLHNETIELVALATEKILQQKVDTKADQSLMASALKDVE